MKRYLLVLLLFLWFGCARPRPVLTLLPPTPIGEEEQVLRDLYRSFWHPPLLASDTIRIGLLYETHQIQFRALHPMTIRGYSSDQPWQVASPAGVTWTVEAGDLYRPPIVTYHAAVSSVVLDMGKKQSGELLNKWRMRYGTARWVGPPPSQNDIGSKPLVRWLLSVSPPTSEKGAKEVCQDVRSRFKSRCDVAARVDLPPISRGLLTAEKSNFSREFRGAIELISSRGPVEIKKFTSDELRNEQSDEAYGGKLFIVPGWKQDLALVQSTTFENYLEGVVPAETYPDGPEEALKAQAVIARTYAARQVWASQSDQPFVICGNTNCQVYRGVKLRTLRSSQAVRDTRDLVLWDPNDRLAETFYHSICGGHTEPRTAVWGPPSLPYLRGSVDQIPEHPFVALLTDESVEKYLSAPPTSFCGTSKLTKGDRWRWNQTLDSKAIDKILDELQLSPPLLDVRIGPRGVSGRVFNLELRTAAGTKKIKTEYEIRKLLGGLFSSLFVLELIREGDRIVKVNIHGGGYGHGVGLCQMGAIGRAEAGQTFENILQAYYPGTHVAPLRAGMLK